MMNETENVFFSDTNEIYEKMKYVKATGKFNYFLKRINESYEKLFRTVMDNTKANLIYSNIVNSGTMNIAFILIFFIGGREVVKGNLSIGTLTIISSYYQMVNSSVIQVLSYVKGFETARGANLRIPEILNLENEKVGDIS